MAPREYSSAATADDAVSTEGITFKLDGVEFTCHGRISSFDLAEFAGPAADADEAEADGRPIDPALVRVLGDLTHVVLGDPTHRQFTSHRRKHHTPDDVVQQILLDVIEEATSGRPSARLSPSPAGPQPPQPSPAVSPSPAGPASPRRPVQRSRRLLQDLQRHGEVLLADAPGPDAATPGPRQGGRVRRLSLARPGVEIIEQPAPVLPPEESTG